MRVPKPLVLLLPGTLLFTACFGSDLTAVPEVHRIPGLSLDEARVHASVDERRATVTLPLSATDGPVDADVTLRLVDIGGESDRERSSVHKRVHIDGSERLSFSLSGIDPTKQGSALARYVVRYAIETRRGTIRGAKDLWSALSKAELQVLAAQRLPVGVATPVRIFARDPATLAPLPDAEITVRLETEDGGSTTLARGTTDASGRAVLQVEAPAPATEGHLVVRLEKGALQAEVAAAVSVVTGEFTTLLLSTDKPRYQPGQTVHLRLLALTGTDRRPLAEAPVIFEAYDAKGNKVFKERATTSGYGIAAVDLPLAEGLNLGSWTLRAVHGEASTERVVTVERYALPKFEVRLRTDSEWYAPGETIQGVVEASYFFGRPVSGSVRIELQAGDVALETLQGTLENGAYRFELTLPSPLPKVAAADGRQRPLETVVLFAEVVDSAAQVATTTRPLPLSGGDLNLVLVPADRPVYGLPLEVVAAVSDPTGRPVSATLQVPGQDPIVLDAYGVGRFEVVPEVGATTVHAEAQTADGRFAVRELELSPAREGLVLRTARSIYRAGEQLTLEILATPSAPQQIAVDLGAKGRALGTFTAALEDGQGSFTTVLPSDLRGVVTVEASYLGRGGRLISTGRTLYVAADDDLQVEVKAPQTVRPGSEATLSLAVRDGDGTPVPAALGVAVVDPAVFALGGERPGADDLRLAFGDDLPPTVAGRAADRILIGDPAEREAAAALLFAVDPARAAWSLDANSYRAELAEVTKVVRPRFDRTIAALKDTLQQLVEREHLSEGTAPARFVERAGRTADVFGRPLVARFSTEAWALEVTSSGPDEVLGSADDLEASISLWELLYSGEGEVLEEPGDVAFDADGTAPPRAGAAPGSEEAPATRVRSWFPETLLSLPEVVTDESGEAEVTFPVADAITTWKVSASAVSREGRLGSGAGDLVVFQEFFVDANLPPTVTRNDELEIPVAVYNYLPDPQSVTVRIENAPWFDLLSPEVATVSVAPGEVGRARFRIRAKLVGTQPLTLRAEGSTVSDALRRTLVVEPGGEKKEETFGGRLSPGQVSHQVYFPAEAIPGSESLRVKVYPGMMTQAVEGIEAVVREPHGCFEQSTSATWPNVMVAKYFAATGTGSEETVRRTVEMVQRGYQLLVSYEAPQGGFNWWGDDTPGNKILTAFGILILEDMKGIIEVDQALIDRSAAWLAAQQQADGSWPKGDALHMGNEFISEDPAIVTAFAVEALDRVGGYDQAVRRGLAYLADRVARRIQSKFTLAIAARALAAAGHPKATEALQALREAAEVDAEARYSWAGPNTHSWTGASGESAGIETTAVAAQAFLRAAAHPDVAQGALDYLAAHKDSFGGWAQTQATVQALRAFTLAASGAANADAAGTVVVRVDGAVAGTLEVTPDNADVVRILDLSAYATPGIHEVQVEYAGTGQLMYQIAAVHHLDWSGPRAAGGVRVDVSHSATTLDLGALDTVRVEVGNESTGPVDQVLVKVGLSGGLSPVGADLDGLVAAGRLTRWEPSVGGAVLYLSPLGAGEQRVLSFRARAVRPGQWEAPATVAYRYYQPQEQAVAPPLRLTVRE